MYNQTQLQDLVDKAILNLSYNTEADKLIGPVKYILSVGGKRLRPVMALMACNLFIDNIEEAVFPSAGIEVFHNFTLVHDDIMDQASLRRNFPTVHTKWNLNQAILSGDVMAFIANDCFLQLPDPLLHKVLKIYNKAAVDVCVGQQMDMDFEKVLIVNESEYLRMIELKTAALLAGSLKVGAVIGGAEERDCDLLYDFGKNLGLAFQIQDDLLDIYGDSKIFGKIHGGDIVANKKTFLLVKSLELSNNEQKKRLNNIFRQKKIDPVLKVKDVMAIYDELKIQQVAVNLANDYISQAFSLFEKVSVPVERKRELSSLAGSLIGRNR